MDRTGPELAYINPRTETSIITAVQRIEPKFKIFSGDFEIRNEIAKTSIDELYHEKEAVSDVLIISLQLLGAAISKMDQAVEMIINDNPMAADHEMQYVQSLLPELFCCRTISNGFEIVINAIVGVFENLQGTPMNRNQIETLSNILKILRSEPYLSLEKAVTLVSGFEAVDLKVDPPKFEYLADLLSE